MTRFPAIASVAACLGLAGCLFETHTPKTVPLVAGPEFKRFDPLVITFVDSQGNIQDTLFRGSGGAEELWSRLTADGLRDTGFARMEGYSEGELRYSLDVPWPADTLFAMPRWSPVGKPISDAEFDFVSLGFRNGKPAAYVSWRLGAGSALAEFDGREWRDGPVIPLVEDINPLHGELAHHATGDLLIHIALPLRVRKLIAGQWLTVLVDSTFGTISSEPSAMAYELGDFAAVNDGSTDSILFVRFRQYESEEGWAATEKKLFPGYQIPYENPVSYLSPGARKPVLARRDGEAALLLQGMGPITSGNSEPGDMKLFRRRNGEWDSTPGFPPVRNPAIALEGGRVYMAYTAGSENWNSGDAYLRRYGTSGWEEVGPGKVFDQEARGLSLKFHAGIPYIGATGRDGRFRLARLVDGRWETLVQPRFQDFETVLDFKLDEAGTPYLAVSGSEKGTRIVKYTDPHRP